MCSLWLLRCIGVAVLVDSLPLHTHNHLTWVYWVYPYPYPFPPNLTLKTLQTPQSHTPQNQHLRLPPPPFHLIIPERVQTAAPVELVVLAHLRPVRELRLQDCVGEGDEGCAVDVGVEVG